MNTELKVWKTIKLGVGPRSGEEFIMHLRAHGYHVDYSSEKYYRAPDFVWVPIETDVDLIRVTSRELGIEKHRYTFPELCKKALDQGLELCPSEVGPQLRLQLGYQKLYDGFYVAMKPIMVGPLPPPGVRRGGCVFWLSCKHTNPGWHFGAPTGPIRYTIVMDPVAFEGEYRDDNSDNAEWVFMKPRKST